MREHLRIRSNSGMSVETQVRALSLISWLIDSFQESSASLPEFYEFGQQEMTRRWDRIIDIFQRSQEPFELVNAPFRGGFAWIRCLESPNCQETFDLAGIKGSISFPFLSFPSFCSIFRI